MININISRKHIIFLVLILAVATVINYTIAQGGTQSHPISEITNLDADGDGTVDLANNSNYLGGQLPAYYEGGGCAAPFTKVVASPVQTCTAACGASTCAFGYKETSSSGFLTDATDMIECGTTGPATCLCCA